MTKPLRKKFVIVASVAVMVLGWLLGALFISDSIFGFMDGLKDEIASFGIFGVLGFGILFVAVNALLFFVSGFGSAFIYAANLLFPTWLAFVVSTASIFLVSVIIYYIGRKIGVKAFKWAFTDEEYAKANEVIGSPTFIVLALLLPGFPDTLVCFLAGSSEMKPVPFSLIALVTRTLGVAGICFFGTGVLSIDTWSPVFDAVGTIPALMLMFATLISFLVLVVSVYLLGKRLEHRIKEKRTIREASK